MIPEQTFFKAVVPASNTWQQISIALDGNSFQLRIGSSFEKDGPIEEDGRAALTRRTKLVMRLGSFQRMATLPEIQETL